MINPQHIFNWLIVAVVMVALAWFVLHTLSQR
jgi:ACR3 family arsenite efflux pump ArsB